MKKIIPLLIYYASLNAIFTYSVTRYHIYHTNHKSC